MPIVRSDIPDLLTAGLRTEFNMAYQKGETSSLAPLIATIINTTLPSQKYGWLGAAPVMREMLDERQPAELSPYGQTIEDKEYEATIAVDRKALEDDQYDMIKTRVRDLGKEAARHQEQLATEQYAKGATLLCYDGQYFFDTDHSEGDSGTQSNKTTNALSKGELETAIYTMQSYKDDKGKPMRITPTHLMVGPKLEFKARELLESQVAVINVGDGTAGSGAQAANPYSNLLKGRLQLIVNPYLLGTYDDYWMVLDLSREVKGVLLQRRSDVPIEFAALDNPNNNEQMFMRGRILYGARGRYGIGYGLWQTAYGGIL